MLGESSTNLLFPREAVPTDLGARLRAIRMERGLTQEWLAAKTGVTRWTIGRIEAGRNVPGSYLVHAIERVLDLGSRTLVPDWNDGPDHQTSYRGPCARRARIAVGRTLAQVAEISGICVKTISRFERGLGNTPKILRAEFRRGNGFSNDQYARAHMFLDANEMEQYSRATEPERWLSLLVQRKADADQGRPSVEVFNNADGCRS